MDPQVLWEASTLVLPVLVAITLHEAAHGWVAWKLGDDTAYQLGRVTFNPIRHIDPFGTILLPGMLLLLSHGQAMLGYAKPVPVDFLKLRHLRRDMVLVAAAGPGINIAIACIAALLTRLFPAEPSAPSVWALANLFNAIDMNLIIALFNLLPLPPLDGGRMAVGLLPRELARPLARVEPYGMFIILAVVFVLPLIGNQLGIRFGIIEWLVLDPADWLSRHIFAVLGPS